MALTSSLNSREFNALFMILLKVAGGYVTLQKNTQTPGGNDRCDLLSVVQLVSRKRNGCRVILLYPGIIRVR